MTVQPDTPKSRRDAGSGRYADLGGLRMYYEIHGTGEPLVLLHGALSATGASFGLLLPELAKSRMVIAVEQQAHGHRAGVPAHRAQSAGLAGPG
jgi:pimeloyl-ACP methyl ester carboxylesterase